MKTIKKISLNDTNNRYLVLDTETIHSALYRPNALKLEEVKDVIEISWLVVDCDGNKIKGSKKGFLVEEFWNDKEFLYSPNFTLEDGEPTMVQNFAINKIEKWEEKLKSNELRVEKWGRILKQLQEDITNYNITIFSAYNIKFDRQAIVSTSMIIPYKTFCPRLWNLDFLDLMLIVNIFAKQKKFKKWADNHGAISPKGNYRCSAEAITRYTTNNNEEVQTVVLDSYSWAETHIALEDIEIEADILASAITLSRRKREIKVEVNKNGSWQTFNKIVRDTNTKTPRKSKAKTQEVAID